MCALYSLFLALLLALFVGGHEHGGWHRQSFPAEEWTTGVEVGPADTVWGHQVTMTVRTSKREFAASVGAVQITFYGTRGTSDTHLLQEGFVSGATDVVDIQLTREIGALEKVKLQTNSSDGWLMADLTADIGPTTYYFESTNKFLDYPDSALADRRWDGGARGTRFASDPYGTLEELYEPQAPSAATPAQLHGAAGAEGLLGRESFMLRVVDRADNFRDPFTLREEERVDMDP